ALAVLAAENPDVQFVVMTLPDRHGGEASGWWETARTLAASGLGVLVQCTRSSARDLGVDLPPARGATLHEPPQVVLRQVPGAETAEPGPTAVLPPVEPAPSPEPALPVEPGPPVEPAVPPEPAEPSDELEPSPEPDL